MTNLNIIQESFIHTPVRADEQMADCLLKFKDQHILVIGDFILDAYVHGNAARVCPEAPVPIVDTKYKKYFLGGAANTAINAIELGAKTDLCTLLGNDYVGSRGYQLLKEAGIGIKGVSVMKHKKTQYKTRIIAGDQMLIRMDKGDKKSPNHERCKSIGSFLKNNITGYDGVLIADYDKGFFCPEIIEMLKELREQHAFFLAIDSKRLPVFSTLKPDLTKPNREETSRMLNTSANEQLANTFNSIRRLHEKADIRSFKDIGQDLYIKTGAQRTALTLDQDGAIWFEKDQPTYYQPAEKIDAPQVSGAGDSYIAAALLASLSGFSLQETARIATMAASIVIGKQDTASCNLNELQSALSTNQKALMHKKAIEHLAKTAKQTHRSIIITNGCYDLLHNGHINFLKASAKLGDILVVAINIDEDVTKIKGAGRPINGLSERISLLSALSFVDYVVPFGGNEYLTIGRIIQLLQPVLFTKGENYRYQIMTEQALLKSLHIPLVFIPTNTDKTTGKIIQKIKSNASHAI